MTAVIGILNKRGVALAADSAVTRNRGWQQKVTKNGNKLVRLSNAVPVSVMFTGNGCFLNNPWDVVARRYRQERGDILHSTVEKCMQDFFEYISNNTIFWNENVCQKWIKDVSNRLLNDTFNEVPYEVKIWKKNRLYKKTFISILRKHRKKRIEHGKGKLFENYTLEDFVKYAGKIVDEVLVQHTESEEVFLSKNDFTLPDNIMDAVKDDLYMTIFTELTCRENDAELIFSGFGKDEQYPSLVNVAVYEGIDNRVNYHYREKDVIRISDEHPVAYCPFAQKDISLSLVRGRHRSFANPLHNNLQEAVEPFNSPFIPQELGIDIRYNIIKTDDISNMVFKPLDRLMDTNLKQLEKNLKDYDVRSLAELAESVIDLTGFHRILTFQQEGVGGPVDVAVITKNDGFSWLRRKSWYHHKDVNGLYGSMGI